MCGIAAENSMSKYNRKSGSIRTILPEKVKTNQNSKFSPARMKIFEVIEHLQTNTNKGLSAQNAQKRRKKHGLNILYPEFKRSFSSAFLDHLKAVVSVLLALSLFIFYAFNKNTEYLFSAVLISGAIFIDCIFEHIASKKFENVRKSSSLKAIVKRDGKVYITDSRYLVPGDLVYLQQGCIVPADIRLFDSNGLTVLETPLTGEENEVNKYAKDLSGTHLQDETPINMAFAGSIVSDGNAWGIVCFTGSKTKFHNTKGNSQNNVPAIFKYVYSVSSMLSITSSFIGALILIFGIFFTSTLTSIYLFSLAVTACSFADGIVSLSALSFSSGISRLKKDGAILRNLSSIEPLALTDSLLVKQNTVFPILKTEVDSFYLGLDKISDSEDEKTLIKYFLVCSTVRKTYSKGINKHPTFEGKQNAVAVALYGEAKGISLDSVEKDFLITETHKAETDEWFSALAFENNQKYLFVKGTPAEILPLCKYHNTSFGVKKITKNDLNNYYSFSSVLTNDAGYILAIAKCDTGIDKLSDYDNEPILTLCGFVRFTTYFGIDFFKDVSECKKAGIDVGIFSSDAYMRAYNLSKNSGIFSKNEQVITAEEMSYISKKEFEDTFSKYKLFMDFSPTLSNDVVMLRKKNGSLVAVSAESTNELLLMKNSDVSFVIDGESSDMIKQSSDVILHKGGFDIINKVLSTSKTIYRRIHSLCEYAVYSYLSIVLIYILSALFGLSLRIYDYLISSTLISGVIGLFLATTSMPDKSKYSFPKKRKKVATPNAFRKSFFLSLECSLFCVLFSKFASMEKSHTIFIFSFSIFSILAAITILNSEKPFYSGFFGFNKSLAIVVMLMIILILFITSFAPIVKYISYGKIALSDVVFPLLLSLGLFVFNSAFLYIGKKTSK